MEFKEKKRKMLDTLQERELYDVFEVRVDEDEYMLLQSEQNIKNGVCLISVPIEDTPFNCIYYFLGTVVNKESRLPILEIFNELNLNDLIVQYYLEDDSVMARIVYITSNNTVFNAIDFIDLIWAGYYNIEKNYSKIIKAMRL